MNYALVVDSAAALPESILTSNSIFVLPIIINFDGETQDDVISESELVRLYQGNSFTVKTKLTTAPPSPEQVKEFLLSKVILHADNVICLSLSKATSSTFENVKRAAESIADDARVVRTESGINEPLRITALNSATTIAGYGLVAIYADRLLSKEQDFERATEIIKQFINVTRTYVIVRDLVFSRKRALQRGVKTIGYSTALLCKTIGLTPIVEITRDKTTPVSTQKSFFGALEQIVVYLIQRIEEGLFYNVININYAGDLDDLFALSSMERLKSVANQYQVKLLFGVMGLASSAVYGPGAFSVGIAPKNQAAVLG
ncbi:MAG: DegV family protein [Gammaproteobacteria bacterium]|nr:DegV family protein [Gammaproteobacteria bacterium]